MPAANLSNVAAHRGKYALLAAHHPADDVGRVYVGGGDANLIGWVELEFVRRFGALRPDSAIVDVGCGIGRLARHLVDEPFGSYLGLDVVPEIVAEAEHAVGGDPRFRFALVETCAIPAADASIDLATLFSVTTNLLDEEIFEYLADVRRVLKSGGVGILSFLDLDAQRDQFYAHARVHRTGHGDLLKFITPDSLEIIARGAGFDRVEFLSCHDAHPASGTASRLMPHPPSHFSLGQAVCLLG